MSAADRARISGATNTIDKSSFRGNAISATYLATEWGCSQSRTMPPRLNRRFAAKSNRDVREDCGLFTAGTLTRSWMVLWATHSVRRQQLDRRGLTTPANLFYQRPLSRRLGEIGRELCRHRHKDFDCPESFHPDRRCFAIDPFQGQISTYDPNLSVSLDQELPSLGFIPGQWAAVIDSAKSVGPTGFDRRRAPGVVASRFHRLVRVGLSLRFLVKPICSGQFRFKPVLVEIKDYPFRSVPGSARGSPAGLCRYRSPISPLKRKDLFVSKNLSLFRKYGIRWIKDHSYNVDKALVLIGFE